MYQNIIQLDTLSRFRKITNTKKAIKLTATAIVVSFLSHIITTNMFK